jgi:hypothetical protein
MLVTAATPCHDLSPEIWTQGATFGFPALLFPFLGFLMLGC